MSQRVTYTYDSYDNETSGFNGSGQWGHVAAVATGNPTACTVPGYPVAQQFTQMFSYNATGRVTTKRLELDQPGTNPEYWDVNYTYNQLGQMVTTTYPGATTNSAGITYTTGYDSVDRPATLKDSRGITAVQGVTYNAANQPLQTTFQYPYGGTFTETRTYNQLNELIAINNFGGTVSLAYNFTGGQNNGQIASSVDNGTTISYSYDLLKRLTSASSGAWSQTYGYDGFENLTAKNGSGATFTNTVDQTTNRLTGGNYCYDADGNMISDQNGGGCANPNYTYDVANRLVSAKVSGGTQYYLYSADNKRIAVYGTNAQGIIIYGAFGEKLMVVGNGASNVYFAGRLIKQNTDGVLASADNNFVAVDRMGSVVYAAPTSEGALQVNTSYLPYGEELSATTNDVIKFATYTRDSSTGLDYADQRFYTSQFGRFMSADRSHMNVGLSVPGSWNKYTYVLGDPVNGYDPTGRSCVLVDDGTGTFVLNCNDGGTGLGGGGTAGPRTPCTDDRQVGIHADCAGSPSGGGGDEAPTSQNKALLLAIQGALDAALSNPLCASIFGSAPGILGIGTSSTPSAANVLDSLIGSTSGAASPYGSIRFVDPGSGGLGASLLADSGGAAITIANNPFSHKWLGAASASTVYINDIPVGDNFNTSVLNAETTILHELGHVLSNLNWKGVQILPDTGNLSQSDANNALIQSKCGLK